MKIKYLLYQAMLRHEESVPYDKLIGEVPKEYVTLYGTSGFKTKVDNDVAEKTNFATVGSAHIKFETEDTTKISLLIFKTGTMKISGGLSKAKAPPLVCVKKAISDVCTLLKIDTITYTMNMINAQFKIHMTADIFMKSLSKLNSKYPSMKNPTFSGRGKITSARVYPYAGGRKSHLAYDSHGTVQMFGFRTFEEVEQEAASFYSHLKEI